MTEDLYKEFDEIMHLQKQVLDSSGETYNGLLENVKRHTIETKYGTQNMYLGYFCPSLVMDKTVSGFKRGRIQNDIPKTKSGDYVVYDIDIEGRLLRIQDINSFGTVVETYIIRENNTEYSVQFSDGQLTFYNGPSTRTIYEKGKVKRFDIIDNSSMWSEIYKFNPENNYRIECSTYYYVPNLKGADKAIPIGTKGSPARLYLMDIELNKQEKVVKIEHFEYIEGRKVLTYTYSK
jgi:hypothetical protein